MGANSEPSVENLRYFISVSSLITVGLFALDSQVLTGPVTVVSSTLVIFIEKELALGRISVKIILSNSIGHWHVTED